MYQSPIVQVPRPLISFDTLLDQLARLEGYDQMQAAVRAWLGTRPIEDIEFYSIMGWASGWNKQLYHGSQGQAQIACIVIRECLTNSLINRLRAPQDPRDSIE